MNASKLKPKFISGSSIKFSNFVNFKHLASLIRNHSLYEPTGEIRFILNDIERGYLQFKDVSIVIGLFDGNPIACALTIRKKILCYVKPEFRRNKVGTQIVSLLKNEYSYATIGFPNSDLFWQSLKIPVL